jgi:hypothetical protein
MSQSELRLYWGVPEGVEVLDITIRWPGGATESISDVPLDETLVVIESRSTGEGRVQIVTP